MTPRFRPAHVGVDLGAIRANVTELRRRAAPAAVLAVVKADAYGHGAVPVAQAALEVGAAHLGVAIVEEGVTLRAAGIDAPILLLSEPPAAVAPAVVEHSLTATVYTEAGIDAIGAAATAAGVVVPVHLKVDTGMHRVGAAAPTGVDHLADIEIGLRRGAAIERDRGIGLAHEGAGRIAIGVDRDRADAHAVRGAHHAPGDLAAVGDQQSTDWLDGG